MLVYMIFVCFGWGFGGFWGDSVGWLGLLSARPPPSLWIPAYAGMTGTVKYDGLRSRGSEILDSSLCSE